MSLYDQALNWQAESSQYWVYDTTPGYHLGHPHLLARCASKELAELLVSGMKRERSWCSYTISRGPIGQLEIPGGVQIPDADRPFTKAWWDARSKS